MAEINNIPQINGVGYSWGQIILNVLGTPIYGVIGISYKEDQAIENTFGAGNFPVERGFGEITFEGSLELHMKELELLQDIAPNGRLQEIPEFDVVVSYINEQRPVTHILKSCRFKNNGRENGQGDTEVSMEIELAVGSIVWNA